MTTRCKFACTNKVDGEGQINLTFSAVINGSPENDDFFKWTPSGQLTFGTVNQSAIDQFEVGKEYFIDISPAE